MKKENLEAYNKFVASASVKSSEQERIAEQTERDVKDLMQAAYMTQFIGDVFWGIISGITNFGIFVQLENSVEGLIRLENIQDDYYVFDEDTRTLTGSRHQKMYRIGQSVEVMLVKTNLLTRQIDFVFSEDATRSTLSSMRRKEIRTQKMRNKKSGVQHVHRHKNKRRGRKYGTV